MSTVWVRCGRCDGCGQVAVEFYDHPKQQPYVWWGSLLGWMATYQLVNDKYPVVRALRNFFPWKQVF